MCGGEGTAMWGEPRVAAECTCTEREFGRCARPTVRSGRNVHDERDHGRWSERCPAFKKGEYCGLLHQPPMRFCTRQ